MYLICRIPMVEFYGNLNRNRIIIKRKIMKNKIFISKSALWGVLSLIFFVASCTRDDYGYKDMEKSQTITFTAQSSSLTKSGISSSEIHSFSSEQVGTDATDAPLFLNATSSNWDIEPGSAAATKVTPYNAVTKLGTEPFGVLAYTYNSSGATSSNWSLYQAPVKAVNSSSKWIPETKFYWPGAGKFIRFYAYAPYDNITVTATSTAATIDYSTPTAVADMQDLVIADSGEKSDSPTIGNIDVPLTFNHALAGVRFKSQSGVVITSVKVYGINDAGRLNLFTLAWSNLSKSGNTYQINNPTTQVENGYNVFTEDLTMMFIPSASLPASAKVEFTIEGISNPIIASISGHAWEQGKVTTYILDNSGQLDNNATYKLEIIEPTDLTYEGKESITGRIYSYKVPDGTTDTTAIGWVVEGFYQTEADARIVNDSQRYAKRIKDGVNGTYLKSFSPTEGAGISTKVGSGQVTITHPSPNPSAVNRVDLGVEEDERINSITTDLGSPTADGYYNLSDPASSGSIRVMRAANTYIINQQGYYRIPLVMGNSIQNNADIAVNTTNYPAGFKNYLNETITSGRLHRSSANAQAPKDAFVVWADWDFIETDANWQIVAPGTNAITVTNPGNPSYTCYWLNFHVKRDQEGKMQQGIAHIAVRDQSNRVMWSWLIWLTDYKPLSATPDPDITTYNLSDYSVPNADLTATFMPRNIGWVERGFELRTSYPSDEVYVRLVQKESKNVEVMKILRPEADTYVGESGYCPYYQWGRITPIYPSQKLKLGAEGYSLESQPAGFVGRYTRVQYMEGPQTIGTAIQTPERFINRSMHPYDWCSDHSNTLQRWSLAEPTSNVLNFTTSNAVVKSIYDPSPYGYKMPSRNQYTFTRIGTSTTSNDWSYSTVENEKSKALFMEYYTSWRNDSSDPTTGLGTIKFPPLGYRLDQHGQPVHAGRATYWTATVNIRNLPLNEWMASYLISPALVAFGWQAAAMPIRCVRE